MGAQEDSPLKKKEFQKRTDEDIDSFLARKEFTKSAPPTLSTTSTTYGTQKTPEPTQKPTPKPGQPPEQKRELTDEDREEAIRLARTSRAEREAYHDVAVLRKKAHAYGHKAAKFYRKHKAAEAVAQKCAAKAVAYREKAASRREKSKDYMERAKSYEEELGQAAHGTTELSPESLRTRIATMERKAAKEEEVARRNEAKAAAQTEKGAKCRSKAAKFLEQNKLSEVESRRYAKRADNLEKAGP